MITNENVETYYDAFADHQKKVAYNLRHLHLYQQLKNLGLKSNSSVLELGCGIGVISSLMLKTVKSGLIESVDISPKSIKIAKEKLKKHQNFKASASDILTYSPTKEVYDFITLFDVIEHIPIELHPKVFEFTSKYLSKSGILVINIPHPDYVEFDRKYYPERLQVIDQSVQSDLILKNAYSFDYQLIEFKTYSLWAKGDYQFMTFKKQTDFQEIIVSEEQSFFQKLYNLIVRKWNSLLLGKY